MLKSLKIHVTHYKSRNTKSLKHQFEAHCIGQKGLKMPQNYSHSMVAGGFDEMS